MLVYDNKGNMANERASEVAQNMAKQVKDLFESLFVSGMTGVEARALSGYLQTQIEFEAVLCLLYQQIPENREPVFVEVDGKTPICLDRECPHTRECANHTTAGDYRSEDGATPTLVETESSWECGRSLTEQARGAILTDGSFAGDWRHND